MNYTKLKKIPTNIITGFLGVGKTSAILHLLANKPPNEKWAVLVNEFGEVGIDGSALHGSETSKEQVSIKEVAGGCMCCTADVSMRVALNTLLRKTKPDRLIIEPSGIGHPEGVLKILKSDFYQDIIEVHQTIVLVDARKITDKRYNQHPIYLEQLDIADTIIANKVDLYEQDDLNELVTFLEKRFGEKTKPFFQVNRAELPISLLLEKGNITDNKASTLIQTKNAPTFKIVLEDMFTTKDETLSFPDTGFISIKNKGSGYISCGWIFKEDIVFDALKLQALLSSITAERIKGVFLTPSEPVFFNSVDGELTQSSLKKSLDSRLEIIAQNFETLDQFESDLLNCVASEQ